MAENGGNSERHLSEQLRELESLLEQRSGAAPGSRSANVPVLDDVVEPGPDEPDPVTALPPDIAALARRLEEKFALELDEIIGILKGNLRANIAEELLAQLADHDHRGPEGKQNITTENTKDTED